MPYETEPLSSTSQPCVRWECVNSQTSRDLPTPGSPTSATTCPWPCLRLLERLAELIELAAAADEAGQPARGRRLEPRSRPRPAPISSKTSTGSGEPLDRRPGRSDLTWT